MPSTMGSLAEGIWGVVDRERAIAREDDQKRSDLEGRALLHLTSADDPEIAAHAWAGLMNLSQPRTKSKGLRGFFGETEANPELGRIQALLQTPVARQVTEPGDPTAYATPLKVGGAAVPQAGGIQPGQVPPPTAGTGPTAPSAPPQAGFEAGMVSAPQFVGGPPPPPTHRTVMEPRRPFLMPEEREIQGAFRGHLAMGETDEQAMENTRLERQRYGRYGTGGLGAGAIGEGNVVPDPDSPTGYSQLLYDHHTGQPVRSIPAMAPRLGAAGSVGEGNVIPDPSSPTGFSQVLYDKATGQEKSRTPAMDPAKGGLANGRGLATVVNPITGEVYVVNKAGVMAEDPNAVRQVGAPAAPGTATPPPAPPAGAGASPVAAGVAPPPAAATSPAAATAPTAPPGPLSVGSLADRQQAKQDATLVEPKTLALYHLPSGTTQGDLRRMQIVPPTGPAADHASEVQVALQQFPVIRALVAKLYAGQSGFTGALKNEWKLTRAEAQNNPDYRKLQAAIKAALPGMARANGEKGALTQKDIDAQATSFPDLGEGLFNLPDSQETALAVLTQAEQKLQTTRDTLLYPNRRAPGTSVDGQPYIPAPAGAVPAGTEFDGAAYGLPPGKYRIKGYLASGEADIEPLGLGGK